MSCAKSRCSTENLLKALLLLSRLEIDSPDDDRDLLDVVALLEEIAGDARDLSAGRHQVAVEAEASGRLLANTKEIRSAISNLAFNAVRYTPEGSTITLRWKPWHDGAAIEVEDNGDGFDPIHIPRLTERFYRTDAARSRELGGTGLGLSIVKHIVERHRGRLDISSVQGEGTSVTVLLPLAPPQP